MKFGHSWLVLCFIACSSVGSPPPHAASLPVIELHRIDGRSESLKAALAGSVAVIDLWASWCTACALERPKLERLHAAYAAQGLRVIGLNVGEAPDVVNAYLADNRSSYPIYLDADFRMADALGEKRLPAILVVDRDGRIVRRVSNLSRDTLSVIKTLLENSPK